MRKPQEINFKFSQKYFNRIKNTYTVYVYPTIRSCMESCSNEPLNNSDAWIDTDANGNTINQSVGEAIKIFSYWGCWGFVTDDDIIHLWYSKNVDEARLASILGHELGHTLRPQHRADAKEEEKANKYGTVTEVACRLANSLKQMKEGCSIDKTQQQREFNFRS